MSLIEEQEAHVRVESKPGNLLDPWKRAWSLRSFRIQCAITLPCFVCILILLSSFLNAVESRIGIVLPDPVLPLLPPAELTWLTFGLIYVGLIAGVANLARFPDNLLIALQSYVVMTVVRIAMMYVVPLEAPPAMIPLHDPVVEILGTGRLLTKDLFFSGHTSTMVLLSLTAPQVRAKILFGICAFLVGAFVLIQHVHYTVDVLSAPFFCYASYRLVILGHRETNEFARST